MESVARTRNCEVIAPMTMGDGFEADQLMMVGGAIRDGLAEMAQFGFVVCTMGDGFEADQLMMGGGAIRDGLAEMAQLGFVVCPLVLGS